MTNLTVRNSNISLLTEDVFNQMRSQCEVLVKSGFLPSAIKTAESALAVAMKGRELGLPMMLSFSYIYVIDGKTGITAEGMNYLIKKNCPEAKIRIIKRDTLGCILSAWRPGMDTAIEFSFTIEDAKKALLMASHAWQRYPKNMCFNRAFSDMARTLFPDCIGGLSYMPEEIECADIDEDGYPIDTDQTAQPSMDAELV